MCGRYTLSTPADQIAEILDAERRIEAMPPRYNIAPTQEAPIVRTARDSDRRELVAARWGLVPWWADDPSIGNRLINARSETAASRRAFRDAFRRSRCLVPADGFFEWTRGGGGGRQPYLIRAADGRPLVFAGLWDRWRGPGGERLDSFTILTTRAEPRVAVVHDRMPVLLDEAGRHTWLESADGAGEALRQAHPGELEIFPVSRFVNSPANDSPRCVEPLHEPPEDDAPMLW